jgi:DNA-binding MarR family transcriptional regulator
MDYIPLLMSLLNQLRLYQNRRNATVDPLYGKGVVLYHLCHHSGAALSGELGRHLKISTPRMAAILSSLENQGFVVREKSDADRRKVIVRVTEKGRDYVNAHDEREHQQMQNLIDKLGPKDSATLLYILQKVLIVLNSYEDLSLDHMTDPSNL